MLNVEPLEGRRLLSGVLFPGMTSTVTEKPNIGLLALGKHHAESGTVGGLDHSDSFNFTLSQPTQVTLALGSFTNSAGLTLVRTGRNHKVIAATTATPASSNLVRSLDAGSYSVSVSAIKKRATAYTLSVSTDSVAAPSRLEAEAWGGNSVHLNWNDNTVGETGYLIQRYTHKGWKNVETVPANSTAALVDNLVPNATTTYRVLATGIKRPLAKGYFAVQGNGGSSSGSTNNASATTQPTDTSGLYKVSITEHMAQAYAAWNIGSDGLTVLPQYQDKWLYASSWQAAVWTAVNGSAVVYVTDHEAGHSPGDIVTHNFPNGGDFKVGTGAEIAASSGVEDFKLPHGSGDTQKLISLEDSYGAIDRDYDDFYWKVATQFMPKVSVTHDQSEDGAENGRKSISFTFHKTGETSESLDVFYTLTGSATPGTPTSDDSDVSEDGDFSAPASVGTRANGEDTEQIYKISIPSGQSSVDLTLPVFNDGFNEGDETLDATIVSPNTPTYDYDELAQAQGKIKDLSVATATLVDPVDKDNNAPTATSLAPYFAKTHDRDPAIRAQANTDLGRYLFDYPSIKPIFQAEHDKPNITPAEEAALEALIDGAYAPQHITSVELSTALKKATILKVSLSQPRRGIPDDAPPGDHSFDEGAIFDNIIKISNDAFRLSGGGTLIDGDTTVDLLIFPKKSGEYDIPITCVRTQNHNGVAVPLESTTVHVKVKFTESEAS